MRRLTAAVAAAAGITLIRLGAHSEMPFWVDVACVVIGTAIIQQISAWMERAK